MKKVVEELYKISGEINGIFNGLSTIDKNHFCAMGKIFDNRIEASQFIKQKINEICCKTIQSNGEVESVDCRNEFVDNEIKKHIYDRICVCINEFYSTSEDEDEFLLMLGFAINMYYIVGLYSTYGKFDINRIMKGVDSDQVKEYGVLINEFLYSKIVSGILASEEYMEFEDANMYDDIVNKIIENREYVKIEKLYEAVKSFNKNYIPDIYMVFKENDFERESDEYYLDKMVGIYPDFRFGWVYRCIQKGLAFYNNGGRDIDLFEMKDKLGIELFLHILGVKSLEDMEIIVEDAEIKVTKTALFSNFGIGIPSLEIVNEQNNMMFLNHEEKKRTVTIADIRKRTQRILDINIEVSVDKNPLTYMGKLLELVEKQREELDSNNKELLRLNNQRRNLMNHLEHSWGNECYPEIVKKVANELMRDGNSSLANRLYKAYNSERNLMGEIIYLQAAMEDEPGKLKEIFQDSFLISEEGGPRERKIQYLIEETLENLVFMLLNYNGDNKKRNTCKAKLCVKHSLAELAEDYAKRFEKEEKSTTESFVEWFSNNVFPITVTVDKCWNELNFGYTEYGKIVMKNIFTELFTNVLFHGNGRCYVILDSTDDKLYVKVKNNIVKKSEGRKKGLSSLREVIVKLNYGTVVLEEEGIRYGLKTESEYETDITFAKELMYL